MQKFSGIIVCFNEAAHLKDSIQSVSPCDQINLYDMGSTDGSIEIAQEADIELRQIPRVRIVEKIWGEIVGEAQNDWIILLDPDEIFPVTIFPELERIIQDNPEIAMFSIPWKYYFLGRPLDSTHWGRKHFKARVFNRKHVQISGLLFDGIKLNPGYKMFTFPYSSGFIIRHYWIDSISQLFSKHWRYIKYNGESRYKKGQRFSLKRQVKDSYKTLRKDLFEYDGIHDGIRGIFLSFFHAWFIFMCYISLSYYQYFLAGKLNGG